jgi:hypothetical protein
MFAFTLESLVLRGSVLRDVLAVELRLGTGLEANSHAPEIRNSMRPPLPGGLTPDGQSVVKPDVGYPTKGITPGAGRSRRQPGAHVLSGAARTTWPTTPWWPANGGTPSAAAATCRAIAACVVAPASEDTSLLLAVEPVSTREGR